MVRPGFGDLAQQMQGQLDRFTDKMYKENSPAAQSRRRGGEKGEIIPEGYRKGQVTTFTPEQMDLFKQLFSNVSPDSYLGRLAAGDEELFNEMEAPALRQFNALQGNIASRFSGTGSRNSSGFQNTMNQEASNFSQDLAARRQELQRQAVLDLQGLSRELLSQRPYEKFLVKKNYPQQQPEKSGDVLGGLFSGLAGAGAGFLTGGVPGAAAGGATGFYSGYKGGF